MTQPAAPTKRDLLNEAFNSSWPIPGYSPSSLPDKKQTSIHSPTLFSLLLEGSLIQKFLNFEQPIIPQLNQLPDAPILGEGILGRLYFADIFFEQIAIHSHLDNEVIRLTGTVTAKS